jgi:hypothetical protein
MDQQIQPDDQQKKAQQTATEAPPEPQQLETPETHPEHIRTDQEYAASEPGLPPSTQAPQSRNIFSVIRRRTRLTDWIIALATVANAIVAYYQFGAIGDSVRQAQRSAKAAEDSVKIARDTLDANKSNFEQTIRLIQEQTTASNTGAQAAQDNAAAAKAQAAAGLSANKLAESNARENRLGLMESRRARLALRAIVDQEPTTEKPVLIMGWPVTIVGATDAVAVRFNSVADWFQPGTQPDIDAFDWNHPSVGPWNPVNRTGIVGERLT